MRGTTIPELLIALMIAGVIMAIAVPRAQAAVDRLAVRSGTADVRAALALARTVALAGHAAVTVDMDSAGGAVRIRRGQEVLLDRRLGAAHGVLLSATRDSLAYDPHGVGRGAANLSVIIRRRTAAETVFVSRLGRVR